ncbi:hypothetical protein [Motilibacter aurantiacus]|uniref:hypothetical protein n=1 Tax=Motilibacter aurantiacus TaxID=2714955 RepID=UPI001409FD8C|nr:hypothetical protein [Motilibacter aurantiacus]NHC47155.1 hypothetical protein [Motilibacter aurantiacus]
MSDGHLEMQPPTEEPLAATGTKIVQFVSIATMASEAAAQIAATRAAARAERDQAEANAARAELEARRGAAQAEWAPLLDPQAYGETTVLDAGRAWAAAQGWRPDPEAERAASAAENRLRELRPDVMERYDRLRAQGAEPIEAMMRVAPYFDAPPARVGDPAPTRAGLAPDETTGDVVLLSDADRQTARFPHLVDQAATKVMPDQAEATVTGPTAGAADEAVPAPRPVDPQVLQALRSRSAGLPDATIATALSVWDHARTTLPEAVARPYLQRAEQRLTELNPHVMGLYRKALAESGDPGQAMDRWRRSMVASKDSDPIGYAIARIGFAAGLVDDDGTHQTVHTQQARAVLATPSPLAALEDRLAVLHTATAGEAIGMWREAHATLPADQRAPYLAAAEARLREITPDNMAMYDVLRAQGTHSPARAMHEVLGNLIDTRRIHDRADTRPTTPPATDRSADAGPGVPGAAGGDGASAGGETGPNVLEGLRRVAEAAQERDAAWAHANGVLGEIGGLADRLPGSTLEQAANVWAKVHTETDLPAPIANALSGVAEAAEQRMRDLAPEAMARYDAANADGQSKADAMRRAVPYFPSQAGAAGSPNGVTIPGQVVRGPHTGQPSAVTAGAASALPAGQAAQAGPGPVADAVDRMRSDRPDVAERYDRLVERGTSPQDALATVGPYLEHTASGAPLDSASAPEPPVFPSPVPGSAVDTSALAAADAAGDTAAALQHNGEARDATSRALAAIPDNPTTARVDEHAEGVQAARPPAAAADLDLTGARDRQATAAEIAAAAYPQPVNSTGAQAARASLGTTAAIAGQAPPADAAGAAVTAAPGAHTPAAPAPAAPRRRAARP